MEKNLKVAVVQSASVLFDKAATIKKTDMLISEAVKNGANLVLFPEAFIPAYPRGLSFGTVVGSRTSEGRRTWLRYWDNSVEIPGKDQEVLGAIAKKHQVYLVIGVIEKDQDTQGTLYCTLLYFSPDGKLIGKHRKLKPTATERIIWGEGDGSDLQVHKTAFGRIGGLICWENYMPLARMALYRQGVQIYLAPTADQRDSWQATMRHIACEGRCYVLGCNQFVTKDMYPADLVGVEELEGKPDILCRGGSVIVDPMGNVIEGPIYDQAEILYANIELDKVAESKFDFDVAGHYARDDVFEFKVKANPR